MAVLVVRGHARIGKQGYIITISTPTVDEKTGKKTYRVQHRIPIIDLELLVLVGTRIAVTTGALLALAKAGIPVAIHGRTAHTAIHSPYQVASADARIAQVKALETGTSIEIAKRIIHAKIKGLTNLAAYLAYRDNADKEPVNNLRQEAGRIQNAKTPRELLSLEAELTKKAWSLLRRHIPQEYGFTARDPKASDPVNKAISYAYAILYTLSSHALTAAGLDPHIGLLHVTRQGSKSLAYDHSEQFKPLAVHAVITASRKHTLLLAPDGLLDAASLEVVTRTLFTYLKRRPSGRTRTNRAYIYTKAWELRNTLIKGTRYTPYTYTPR